MYQFWKKALWATLLTAAFALSATGCTDKNGSSTNSAAVTNAAQADSTASADAGTPTASSEGTYEYTTNADGTISITGYNGTETALEIPATLDGHVVSAIADHAFEANWDIVSVTMPDGLTAIGESAFMDCGSLSSVTISETVSEVRRAAFASCTALTAIVLPEAVSTVSEEAFTGCGSLTSLTVTNASLEYDRWGFLEGAEPLNVTITCPSGSTIESWANENGFATQTLS